MSTVFDLLTQQWGPWLEAFWTTCSIALRAASLSLVLGSILGFCCCHQQSSLVLLRKMACGITFVLRAVPFYVQLSAAYFAVPQLLDINWDATTASCVALGVCSSGYVAQLVQGSLTQLSRSQWETAMVLGYSRWQALRYVIAPQVFRAALPGLSNELDGMLKSTSVLATIGIVEITRMGQNTISRTLDPVPVYILLACLYCGLSFMLRMGTQWLQRRYSYAAV